MSWHQKESLTNDEYFDSQWLPTIITPLSLASPNMGAPEPPTRVKIPLPYGAFLTPDEVAKHIAPWLVKQSVATHVEWGSWIYRSGLLYFNGLPMRGRSSESEMGELDPEMVSVDPTLRRLPELPFLRTQ